MVDRLKTAKTPPRTILALIIMAALSLGIECLSHYL
jgi:hypothetical protein